MGCCQLGQRLNPLCRKTRSSLMWHWKITLLKKINIFSFIKYNCKTKLLSFTLPDFLMNLLFSSLSTSLNHFPTYSFHLSTLLSYHIHTSDISTFFNASNIRWDRFLTYYKSLSAFTTLKESMVITKPQEHGNIWGKYTFSFLCWCTFIHQTVTQQLLETRCISVLIKISGLAEHSLGSRFQYT